jgi:hypothetical protein
VIDKIAPTSPIEPSIKEAIESTKTSINELIECSKIAAPTENAITTYSSTLKTNSIPITTNANTPTQITLAIAQAAVRERQILIQPTGPDPLFDPSYTAEDIALRVESAIDALNSPENVKIKVKAILSLNSRSLLLELNSKEATDWICKDNTRNQLITYLNIQGMIKDRQYPILVPFLPIRHDIADRDWVELVKNDNKLPQGSITNIKWAKPIEKRSENQQVTHMVFTLNNPNATNILLRDGFIIGKTKLHPWKEKREPIRCIKCQHYGHTAKTCTASHNTCTTCGQGHKTDNCDNNSQLFCIECKSREHSSKDLLCLTYQRKQDEISTKHLENLMPFYPMHEAWTHVSLPPTRQPC